MNKAILSSIVAAGLVLGSVFPVAAGYNDPLPNASCVGGDFKLYMNPKGVSSRHAVRIDDLTNPWNPQAMYPGDSLNDNTKGSAYVVQKEVSHEYSWWIHDVDANGVYGPAKSGRVYCRVDSPSGLTATYDYPYVTLKWNAVPGATRYAIRADNQINGWNNDTPNDGDHVANHLTTTEFRFKAAHDRKISWWVHAVDKYGAYSDAAIGPVLSTN